MPIALTLRVSSPSPEPTAMPSTGVKKRKPKSAAQSIPQVEPELTGWWFVCTR